MAYRGRPAKPGWLKKLNGNPGGRKIVNDGNGLPTKAPEAPAELTGDALEEWNRAAGAMLKAGKISTLDRAALAAYATCWGDWLEERRKTVETGGSVLTIENANGSVRAIIANPHATLALKLLDKLKAFATELGLSRFRDYPAKAESADSLAAFNAEFAEERAFDKSRYFADGVAGKVG